MKLAVIIPAHNAAETLGKCLRSVNHSPVWPDRLIVVDDASTDGSGDLAEAQGAEVVRLAKGPWGPAAARNRGARHAGDADVLIFFDADVVVHSNTIRAIVNYLADNPGIDAMFGSYDEDPHERSLASLYKNLLHHYVHQTSRHEASTFWAGCGAIRRDVFEAVGGFDESFGRPSIEDIELGSRLRKQGYHIRLCSEVQVQHLKRWSFGNMVRTDIFHRAIPWTRLMLREGAILNDLNVSRKYRITAAVSVLLVASLLLLPWLPLAGVAIALTTAVLFVTLNFSLLQFFARQGGLPFAVAAGILHLFYNCYSSIAFAVVLVPHRVNQSIRSLWGRCFDRRKPVLKQGAARMPEAVADGPFASDLSASDAANGVSGISSTPERV